MVGAGATTAPPVEDVIGVTVGTSFGEFTELPLTVAARPTLCQRAGCRCGEASSSGCPNCCGEQRPSLVFKLEIEYPYFVGQSQYTSTGIAEALVTRLGLAAKVDVARMIRHYTNGGLLKTVGAVHTGTGRKRVYSEDAVLQAGVLLRLNRLGVPVGVMKEMLTQLRRNLSVNHGNQTLLQVCQTMDDPCLFLVIPDDKGRSLQTKVLERKKFDGAPSDIDAVVISLAKFLK